MKKLFASIISFALVASMSVTAFAADNTATNDGSKGTDITVNGTYKAADAPAEVISVDVMWDSMDFTYTAGSKGEWDASDHQYKNSTEGSWAPTNGTNPKITVTNHSNIGVEALFEFASLDGVDEVYGTFSKNAVTLKSAVGTEFADAPSDTTDFSISGSGIDEDKTLGLITVTISKEETQYVATAEEYVAAIAKGGMVKLTNDIEYLNWNFTFAPNVVIDLNGKTLSAFFSQFTNLTLKNGTINLDGNAIYNTNGSLMVTDCTLNNGLNGVSINNISETSKSTLSGNINLEHSSFMDVGTVTCLAGTYNFNPTSYVDESIYTVTDNKDGTWTVRDK